MEIQLTFKVPFNDLLVGATMRVIVSATQPGRLIEMDGNCFEISAHKR